MQRAELSLLSDIAVAAGREIMDVYRTEFTSWRKADDSPLTHADLRADEAIREGLARAFPGVPVISEESLPEAPVAHDTFFLVDPLDGTKEFLSRNGEFTVNIALVTRGRAVAGVVHAPALRETFEGAEKVGAFRTSDAEGVELRTRVPPEGAALRVIGSRSHGGDALAAWVELLEGRCSFVVAGSSLKFCRLAEGEADVYPRLGPTSQWDTAAGHAVLQAAGGCVLDAQGAELRYGCDRPWLNPNFIALAHAGLREAVPAIP